MSVGKQSEYTIKHKQLGTLLGSAVALNETGAREAWVKSPANTRHRLSADQVIAIKR